jgi:predicted metal-dependent hydrolase
MMLSALLPPKNKIPEEIEGLRVRQHPRARRLALRVDTKTGEVVLVWPKRTSEKSVRRFIAESQAWIEKHRRQAPQKKPFVHLSKVNFCGTEYTIHHQTSRGLTRFEGENLIVHGDEAHISRRVGDFLKAEALRVLTEITHKKSDFLGLKPVTVRVRDPRSRWGSCGNDSGIMYSWRLVMAPPEVMDYVVAHEVAHRVHMNHGRKFWQLCSDMTEKTPMPPANGCGSMAEA